MASLQELELDEISEWPLLPQLRFFTAPATGAKRVSQHAGVSQPAWAR